MKKRILAQILVLCMVFSMLPTTVWAATAVAPYPYIEDVPNSGQISASKTLTVIATSNDLYITSMALKAINVDDGRESIPATSGSLQVSQESEGCYEYKQDFVLTGDLKITGGKWTFEVTSTYKPFKGSSKATSNVMTLPNDYAKERWYRYYTIVGGTPNATQDTTRYRAIPADLTLRPNGAYNAGDLVAVEVGGALAAPGVCVVNSFGAPVTTGPIPTETATISAANSNGTWGISGVTTQSFANWGDGGIRVSFPNLQPYTKTGEAFQNAQVKYTIGSQTVEYDSKVTFNIPGAKVATSNPGIKVGETIELRITEAKDLKYEALVGPKSVTITDVTDGANRRIFNSNLNFISGAATIQLAGSAFTEDTLGERKLDVKIDDIFQTLHTTLTVKTAKNTNTSTATCGTVTVNSSAYVNVSTAVASVSSNSIQDAVNQAAQNGCANVTVKIDIPNSALVDSIQADFPASVINDLAHRTNASLTMTTPLSTITIPNDSLYWVDRNASVFTVSVASQGSNTMHVALSQDDQTVGTLASGMKVEVPTNCMPRTSSVVAVLVNPDSTETVLPKSVLKNNGDLVILVNVGSATIRYQDNNKYFSDVRSDYWASDAINFVSSHGLFQGTSNTTFDSSITMNRAMLVTVLHRLESTPYVGIYSFADVPTDGYYAQAAAWASSKGIVQGDGIGFSGSHAITRQEIVVMLYRYMQTINGSKGQMGSYYGMGGADQVADWANEAMRWAVGSGIIQGDNGNLKPKDSATRAEVAQMMVNFVELITQ